MNDIINQLYQRKSVRIFTDQPVSDETKELLFMSALQAPTAGNLYLYSMIDVTDQEIKNCLSEACDQQKFIASSPMVVVFLADYDKWYQQYRKIDLDTNQPGVGDFILASADAIIAAQNMVVAAHSLGLGSCYIGDIIEQHDTIVELLNLPLYAVPVAMLVIGYPTDQQLNRDKPLRPSMDAIVSTNSYQTKPEFYYSSTEVADSYQRKYCSSFRKEMNQSMERYLSPWSKYDV